MKNTKTKRRSPAQSRRDGRFTVSAAPAVNFRATEPTEFERLKDRLLREQLMTETRAEFLTLLRQAANEAAAVAWMAPYPLLVLPELFREKAAAALRYGTKQASLRRQMPRGEQAEAEVAA
jgi:hypothetical protein